MMPRALPPSYLPAEVAALRQDQRSTRLHHWRYLPLASLCPALQSKLGVLSSFVTMGIKGILPGGQVD